jgi:hypothetical protein
LPLHYRDMTMISMEVRTLDGSALLDWCLDDLDDTGLSADRYAALARSHLLMIRACGGPLTAQSVHFLRGGVEIGSWSLHREHMAAE